MKKLSLILALSFTYFIGISQIQFEENAIFNQMFYKPDRINSMDVDDDNDDDILVTDSYNDRIIWIENNGNGQLQNLHVLLDNINTPAETKIYDINGDGALDILISFLGDDKLAWLRNEGLGLFTTVYIDTTIQSPNGNLCADLDNDGDLDLVVCTNWGTEVWFFINQGNGNFGQKQLLTNEVDHPTSLCAADLNGDDFLDIVSTSIFDTKVAWYKNLGNGTFSPQIIISQQPFFPISAESCDLDNDGINEVVVSASFSPTNNQVLIYKNVENNSFVLQSSLGTLYTKEVDISDLDNNGYLDILTPSNYYLNDGMGTFINHEIDNLSTRITLSDYNNDGLVDLAYLFNDCNLAWKVNLGNGVFGERNLIFSGINRLLDVIYDDIDGDGHKDIIVGAKDKKISICWYKNLSNGNYIKADTILVNQNVISIETVDINGDGILDVLSQWEDSPHNIVWQQGDGFGNFGPPNIIKDSLSGSQTIHIADIDGDGDEDILYGRSSNPGLCTLNLLLNNGSGGFDSDIVLKQCSYLISAIQTTDINNDGFLDIFFTDNTLRVGLNQGTLGNYHFYDIGSNTQYTSPFALADLDGDLDMDIVYACGPGNVILGSSIVVMENTGFSISPSYFTTMVFPAWNIKNIVLQDMDKDGDIDIVAEQFDDNHSLFWMENDGSGTFIPGNNGILLPIFDSLSIPSLVVDDMDGDGDIDILYYSNKFLNWKLAWAENLGFQATDSASSCSNVPYQLGNQMLTTPGIYLDSLLSVNGLDSIIHLNFTHIPLPQVEIEPFQFDTICIEELETTLPLASPLNGTYLGTGLNNLMINLEEAGIGDYMLGYAFTDTITGCSDTAYSQMTIVQCAVVEEYGIFGDVKMYPNPSNGYLNVEITSSIWNSPEFTPQYDVYRTDGSIIQKGQFQNTKEMLNLSGIPSGIYFIKITIDKSYCTYKVILE